MEVGTEISQKIRSAIKAKLIGLGAYVDDELPDYIMVMVANKKSREQMVSDLNLFLGKNTDTFAEWLHGLLGKLQTVSVASSTTGEKQKRSLEGKKEKKGKTTKKSGKVKGKRENSGEVKNVTYSTKNHETNTSVKDNIENANTEEANSDKSIKSNSNIESQITENSGGNNGDGCESSVSAEVEDVRQMLVTVAPTDELAAELEITEARIEQSEARKNSSNKKEVIPTSKPQRKRSAGSPSPERRVQSSVVHKKHKGLTSVVATVSKDNEEEEYDPLCPAVGNVASVVKVTARKSKVPPALQANRALLVKAMGEAERSIAIKRQAVAPRENSPSEVYTPKRRKSSGHEASPPPYIPSRKESSTSTSRTSFQRDDGLERRRAETHRTSSRDGKDLISHSRRMELLRTIGMDRREDSTESRQRAGESRTAGSRRMASDTDQSASRSARREVSGRRLGEVKDLKIMARLGPTRVLEARKSAAVSGEKRMDLRNKGTRLASGKEDSKQSIVNPTVSSALKGSAVSRLGKVVIQTRREPSEREDLRVRRGMNKASGEKTQRGRLAVSRHAKSLVNKQCQEAVLSVKVNNRRLRSVSPDSRRVEAGSRSDDDNEEERDDGDADLVDIKSRLGDKVRVKVDLERLYENKDDDESDDESDEENNDSHFNTVRDPEDLAEMVGEKLEPELLDDAVDKELNLDLEDETSNGNDADDIETLIGMKSLEDTPKPGTRFIVTLDGVGERNLHPDAGGNPSKLVEPSPFVAPSVLKVFPSSQYTVPGTVQPPPPQGLVHHLSPPIPMYPVREPLAPPPVPVVLPRESVKPLPPKIQPFSINLKDSDDELEDKSDPRHHLALSGYSVAPQPQTALQKAKSTERCKFWPACAAGVECEFHHPTSYCKTFPNCKFADKCLFIHPNCRFDSKCTRQDCPFTHTSRRTGLAAPIPKPTPTHTPLATPTVCRFFPNCQNPSCPYLHPKPCRFGSTCQNATCPFYHLPVMPAKNKLKWKAQPLKETVSPTSASFPLPASAASTTILSDPAAKFRQPVAKVSPMSSTHPC